MATTFLKRQKEMKRLEKQREKAERRAQRKLAKRSGTDDDALQIGVETGLTIPETNAEAPVKTEP